MAEQPPPADPQPQPPTETPPAETPPVAASTAETPPAPAPAAAAEAAPAQAAAPAPVPEPSAAAAVAAAPAAAEASDSVELNAESIDALLKQANFDSPDAADADGKGPSVEQLLQQANFDEGLAAELPGSDAEAFKLPSFQQVMSDAQVSSIDLLRDVELNVKIELGRSRMLVDEVLKLSEGSVVELDKLAGDPVDVFVNDRLVARGEVLVLNDNFCVRVNEIVPAAKEEAM